MSKITTEIKSFIEYFMKNKEPIYCNAYKWGDYEAQYAVRWLYHKKFIRYKIEGDYYKVRRSAHFYQIWEKIKDLTPEGVRRFLIEEGKKNAIK